MPTEDKLEWPQGNPLFETHWRSLSEALAGNGIISPGQFEVTATANAMEIQVATGQVFYASQVYTAGSASFTLTASDPDYDRWDTVYFDTSTSTIGVRDGVAEVNPEPPDIQADELLLATVYVPATATDITNDEILNWRTAAPDAQYFHLSNADFNSTNVDDALSEALQGLSELEDYDLSGNSVTDSVGPGTIYDATAQEVVQGVLGGPASSLTSYPLPIGDLNAPFGLPNITDMDVAGNNLSDGATTLYDATAGEFTQANLGGPASSLSAYPLVHGTDTDAPTTAHHTELASGTFIHTTGTQTTETVIVGTDETARFDVVVNTDTGVAADYAYSIDWYRQWDNTNGNLEVVITASWQTDPGSDITLAYSVQER